MENREKVSIYEFYTNPVNNRLVCIEECQSMASVYFVWYRDPGKHRITVVKRCNYSKAYAIAKQYYYENN